MATDAVEFILRARDESAATLARARGGITGLTGAVGDLSAKAGLLGALTAGLLSVAGGVFAAAKAFADQVEQLDNLSGRLGVSVQNLQALEAGLKLEGAAAGAATEALQFLNRQIAAANPLLDAMGVKTRDTWEAFQQVVKVLAATPDAASRTRVAIELLGRGAGEALGPLLKLADRMPTLLEDMEALGVVSGRAQLEAARALDRKLDEIQVRIDGFLNRTKATIAELSLAAFTKGGLPALRFELAIPDLERAHALELGLADAAADVGALTAASALAAADEAAARKKAREEAEKLATVLKESLRDAALAANAATFEGLFGFGPSEQLRGRAEREHRARFREEAGFGPELGGPGLAGAVFKMRAPEANLFAEWQKTAAAATSSVAVMNEGLRALWTGLESGFLQVAANLTNRAQTLRSALKTIFSSLVQEVLAMLARLAAAKVFQLILNLVAPGAGTAAGVVIGAASGADTGGGGAARRGAGAPRDVNLNFNVSALDEGSVLRSLTSPGGALRAAFADAALRRPR